VDFVRLWCVQRQQLRAQAVGVRQVMGAKEPGLARGAYFGENSVNAIEAGTGHEADIMFGLVFRNYVQSSAARLVPRNRASFSDQLAVCCRKCVRCATSSGADPGSLMVIGL